MIVRGAVLAAVLLIGIHENKVYGWPVGEDASTQAPAVRATGRATAAAVRRAPMESTTQIPEALLDAKRPCDIVADSRHMPFPVSVLVDGKPRRFYGAAGSVPTKVATANPGSHVFHVNGIATPVHLHPTVVYEKCRYGEVVWRSEPTQAPCRIELQAGDSVRVHFQRLSEPFTARFLRVRNVDMVLTLTEVYWYRGLLEWEREHAPSEYPNTLFYLVAPEWGPEKVFGDLAHRMVAALHAGPNPKGFYTGRCRVGCQIALAADGSVPNVLRQAPREMLERELKAAFLTAYQEMKQTKCYPELSTEAVHMLKRQGLLSSEVKDEPLQVSLEDGLRMAEVLRRNWVNGHYRPASEAGHTDHHTLRPNEINPSADQRTLLKE